ncbi:hypothetical protein ACVWXU_004624 [Streptomyces sp. TE33382]
MKAGIGGGPLRGVPVPRPLHLIARRAGTTGGPAESLKGAR